MTTARTDPRRIAAHALVRQTLVSLTADLHTGHGDLTAELRDTVAALNPHTLGWSVALELYACRSDALAFALSNVHLRAEDLRLDEVANHDSLGKCFRARSATGECPHCTSRLQDNLDDALRDVENLLGDSALDRLVAAAS